MKTIKAYHFKDLSKTIGKEGQFKVWEKEVDARVEFELEMLSHELEEEMITEEQFYDALGCSKHYAESTGWFVPACYYEKERSVINRIIKEELQEAIFDSTGRIVYE